MKVVAIITEYNPFHNGHKYQIDEVRRILGEDTAIISIMSGNYTQRGEIAALDKTERAKAAVLCGVNLVLELPFPFSCSSAELFAGSGVKIADELGIVDYLAFGTEGQDTDKLTAIFERMASSEYEDMLTALSKGDTGASQGYPEICQAAYNMLYDDDLEREFFTPNNILASQYVKALRRLNSDIKLLPIKRQGAGYSDGFRPETPLQSATYIREEIANGNISALDYTPNFAKSLYSELINLGKMPSDISTLDMAIISHFRLNPPSEKTEFFDTLGGLYNRLYALSLKTEDIKSLILEAQTKKFTTARIRRAILYSYIGVTSSDIKCDPLYTQALAMDSLGCELIKKSKKVSKIPIITKPASYKDLGLEIAKQRELSARADAVFALTFKAPYTATHEVTFTPFVKK